MLLEHLVYGGSPVQKHHSHWYSKMSHWIEIWADPSEREQTLTLFYDLVIVLYIAIDFQIITLIFM